MAKKQSAESATEAAPSLFRDRIVGLQRINADRLIAHPENWRRHPESQRNAMSKALHSIGWAQAVVARKLDDGKYQILDGHLRHDVAAKSKIPVLVVDLNEQEARALLASLDPLGAMADGDVDALRDLLNMIESDDENLNELIDAVADHYKISEDPNEVIAPSEFGKIDEDIETSHECPKCGYKWS